MSVMSTEIFQEGDANHVSDIEFNIEPGVIHLDYEPREPSLSKIAQANLTDPNKERLRRELYARIDQAKFSLEEVLLEEQKQIVEPYLPRRGKMLGQKKVGLDIYGDPRTGGFKRRLMRALTRVDGRYYYGPKAVEVLKPSHFLYRRLLGFGKRLEEDGAFRFVTQIDIDTVSSLNTLAEGRIKLGEDSDVTALRLNKAPYLEVLEAWREHSTSPGLTSLRTLDDLSKAKGFPAAVVSVCGALPMFYEFQRSVQTYFPTWPGWEHTEEIFSFTRQILYIRKDIFNTLEKGE